MTTAAAWTASADAERIAALPWAASAGCCGDAHVHTEACDDATLPLAQALAEAAEHRLDWVVITTHVRAGTPLRRVRDWARTTRATAASCSRQRPGPRVLVSLEAKILDTSGGLDLPAGATDLLADGELDTLHLADHQFPDETGPRHPQAVRTALDAGTLDAASVWDRLTRACVAALARHPGAVLAHPLSIVPKVGLDSAAVPAAAASLLASAAVDGGSAVERNSKWACAPDELVAACSRAGAAVVAASDAHHPGQVARPWRGSAGSAGGAVAGLPRLAGSR